MGPPCAAVLPQRVICARIGLKIWIAEYRARYRNRPSMARCRGGACPSRLRTCSPYRPSLKWYALPNCHCEGASRPWQSREGSYVFAGAFVISNIVLRDCHVALLLAMTAVVLVIARRVAPDAAIRSSRLTCLPLWGRFPLSRGNVPKGQKG